MPYCGQLQRRLPETGAALAYYSVFSLGPIIVIAIAVAGFFFGWDAVSGQVASSTKDMLGDTGAQAIQAMLADAGRPRECKIAIPRQLPNEEGRPLGRPSFIVIRSLRGSCVRAAQPNMFCCRARYIDTRAALVIPDGPHRGRIGSRRNPAIGPQPARAWRRHCCPWCAVLSEAVLPESERACE